MTAGIYKKGFREMFNLWERIKNTTFSQRS
ncbi:hypothetical protein cypCar_00031963 [Cyprinus carpio]|nr:hypothetical protein cypCar_00031963 [Cyprinus carpio]